MTAREFRPAPDPDATVRLDLAAEAREYGVSLDEIHPPEDRVSWNLHWGARLTFSDDLELGDGRGLHYTLATSSDLPVGGFVTKTVTAAQLRTFGESLIALADRAGARRPAGAPHQAVPGPRFKLAPGRRAGATARIKVTEGPSTEWLIAEWVAGAWQSGARRFDPASATDVEPVVTVVDQVAAAEPDCDAESARRARQFGRTLGTGR